MIPDDESVRRAMQQMSPAGADSPDLFDRVAAGARRRRRQRSIGAVGAAAVVVAVVALAPALGHSTPSTQVQPIGPAPSATRVQQLGTGAAQVNPSPVQPNFPGVGPSTIVSPPAVASSPLVVESPSPPLSSTPPTPPLITTGACAGLSVGLSVGDGQNLSVSDLAAEPSLNLWTVKAGWTLSFEASGPVACVNRLAVTTVSGDFPNAVRPAQPNYTFTPPVIRPDGPGVEDIDIMLRPCATASACEGGQLLAEANVSVDPPTTSTANPASSALNVCPTVLPVAPGADAAAQAKAAAVKVVPTIYPPEPTKDFTVTAVYPASSSLNGGSGYGAIAYGTCGKTIGDRTWVVEVHFPHDPMGSASTGNGQLFVSEFATGWKVWYRYH
jgi:stage V sporulation protein SpoVS